MKSNVSELVELWALHNPIKSWTLYNLTESEIKLIILTVSVNELKSVRICKKNENKWQVLNKENSPNFFVKKTTDQYFVSDSYARIEDNFENTAADKEYFVIEPKKTLHPRLHTRYEVNIRCVIVGGGGKEFKAETIDLSEGGFYFKELIPNWVAGYFLVIVAEKFQLMCSLVEDQKEKRRVQVVSEESDFHFIQYKNWLSTL